MSLFGSAPYGVATGVLPVIVPSPSLRSPAHENATSLTSTPAACLQLCCRERRARIRQSTVPVASRAPVVVSPGPVGRAVGRAADAASAARTVRAGRGRPLGRFAAGCGCIAWTVWTWPDPAVPWPTPATPHQAIAEDRTRVRVQGRRPGLGPVRSRGAA